MTVNHIMNNIQNSSCSRNGVDVLCELAISLMRNMNALTPHTHFTRYDPFEQ